MAQQVAENLPKNLSRLEMARELETLKCEGFQGLGAEPWADIEVEQVGDDEYNVIPRGSRNVNRILAGEKPGMTQRRAVRGRQSKLTNPYSQVWSWLRFMNWDKRSTGRFTLEWDGILGPGGSFDQLWSTLYAPDIVRGAIARADDPNGLLQQTLGRKFTVFTAILTSTPTGPAAQFRQSSFLTDTMQFTDHLCEFGQLVRISKVLYTRFLNMVGAAQSYNLLSRCRPEEIPNQEEHDKKMSRLKTNVWGTFHKIYLTHVIYVFAWTWFLGEVLLGHPYGPMIFFSIWRFYFVVAFKRIKDIRLTRPDKRLDIEEEKFGETTANIKESILLAPDTLRQDLETLTGPDPLRQLDLEAPIFPGPPPYLVNKKLIRNWQEYLQEHRDWTQWLGQGTPQLSQYRYDDERVLTRVDTGNSPVLATMFPGCVKRAVGVRPSQSVIDRRYSRPPYDTDFIPVIGRPPEEEEEVVPEVEEIPEDFGGGFEIYDDTADILGGEHISDDVPPGPARQLARALRPRPIQPTLAQWFRTARGKRLERISNYIAGEQAWVPRRDPQGRMIRIGTLLRGGARQ